MPKGRTGVSKWDERHEWLTTTRSTKLTTSSSSSFSADARMTMARGTMVVHRFVGETLGIC